MSDKPSLPAEEVVEVRRFIEVKERLEYLRKQYPGLFDELEELGQQYNTCLEAADKVVRAREVSCGPFDLYQYQTLYNANALYDAVGREEFLKLGGSIQTIQQYDIDKKIFDALAAQGKISEELVKQVKVSRPKYHQLPKFSIP